MVTHDKIRDECWALTPHLRHHKGRYGWIWLCSGD